jgi:hypothetical protein
MPLLTKPTEHSHNANTEHSGSINHVHALHFDSSVGEALKEIRRIVTIVVAGWIIVVGVRTVLGGLMREAA